MHRRKETRAGRKKEGKDKERRTRIGSRDPDAKKNDLCARWRDLIAKAEKGRRVAARCQEVGKEKSQGQD